MTVIEMILFKQKLIDDLAKFGMTEFEIERDGSYIEIKTPMQDNECDLIGAEAFLTESGMFYPKDHSKEFCLREEFSFLIGNYRTTPTN